MLELLDEWIDAHPVPQDARAREELARLHVDLMTGVRLSSVVAWGQDHGGVPPHDAAAAKVFATEMLQRLARIGSELVGIEALEYAPLFASTDARRCGAGWRGRCSSASIPRSASEPTKCSAT